MKHAPSQVDAGTDIFALGLVVSEMATGRHPFRGISRASTIAAILSKGAPSIAAVRTTAADEHAATLLNDVVAKCLAKDPRERWQSAHDVGQARPWSGS